MPQSQRDQRACIKAKDSREDKFGLALYVGSDLFAFLGYSQRSDMYSNRILIQLPVNNES